MKFFSSIVAVFVFAGCKGPGAQPKAEAPATKVKSADEIKKDSTGFDDSCDATKCPRISISIFTQTGTTLEGLAGTDLSWSIRADSIPAGAERVYKLVVLDVPAGFQKQGSGQGALLTGKPMTAMSGTIRTFARDVTYCKHEFPQNPAPCDGEAQLAGDTAQQIAYNVVAPVSEPINPQGVINPAGTKPVALGCIAGSALPGIAGGAGGVLTGVLGCAVQGIGLTEGQEKSPSN